MVLGLTRYPSARITVECHRTARLPRDNVVPHGLNAALLLVLFWRVTGRIWPSALLALLFAVHPLRVDSVAWITEPKNVLSAFFGC